MQLSFLFQQSRITALHMSQSVRSFKMIQRGLVSSSSRNAVVYMRNKNNMMLFSTGTETSTASPVDAVIAAIAAKGDEIRLLKANKAVKERVMPAVNELLKLKADYLALTGTSFDPIKDDDIRLLKGNKAGKEPGAVPNVARKMMILRLKVSRAVLSLPEMWTTLNGELLEVFILDTISPLSCIQLYSKLFFMIEKFLCFFTLSNNLDF
jgi:hypothetical protein